MALIIRMAQLEALRRMRTDAFIRQLIAYIATEYSVHYARLGAPATEAFVRRSIESATRMGIRTAGAVGVLIELWLVYGETLQRAPDREWARNILAHPRLPDYIKVEAVQNRLQERTGGRVLVEAPAPTERPQPTL